MATPEKRKNSGHRNRQMFIPAKDKALIPRRFPGRSQRREPRQQTRETYRRLRAREYRSHAEMRPVPEAQRTYLRPGRIEALGGFIAPRVAVRRADHHRDLRPRPHRDVAD